MRGGGDGGGVDHDGIYQLYYLIYLITKRKNTSWCGFRAWRWLPYCQGADVVFQKPVYCINLPLNYIAAPCPVMPLPAWSSGIINLFSWRDGKSSVFWLPLSGYALQHPERKGQRAVPALDSRRIFKIYCVEEGMAEELNLMTAYLEFILCN